jgi:dTDP-4-amino-4,6-dideoxygalactose transaminase
MQPVFQVEGRKEQDVRRKAGNEKEEHKARVVGGEVSEYLFETGLCLPSGTQMTEEDLERVVNIIKNCHMRNKN